MNMFDLIGHINGLGSAQVYFPQAVAAVGMTSRGCAIAYSGKEQGTRVLVPFDASNAGDNYCILTEADRAALIDFNYASQRLFAFEPHKLIAFEEAEEKAFYQWLLTTEGLIAPDISFHRYEFAYASQSWELILQEIIPCIKKLWASNPQSCRLWYASELRALQKLGNPLLNGFTYNPADLLK